MLTRTVIGHIDLHIKECLPGIGDDVRINALPGDGIVIFTRTGGG